MKFYSEKGYTGVDIAISVIVIFIFVSLISFLIYRFNSSAKEVELKSEATSIAVEEIEKVKQDGFEKYGITHVITYTDGNLNKLLEHDDKYEELYRDDYFCLYKRNV